MGRTAFIEVYVPNKWLGDFVIVPYIRNPRGGGAVADGEHFLIDSAEFSSTGSRTVLDCLRRYFVVTERTPSTFYEVLSSKQRSVLTKGHYRLSMWQDKDSQEIRVYGKTGTELLKAAVKSDEELHRIVIEAMKFAGKEPPHPMKKGSSDYLGGSRLLWF